MTPQTIPPADSQQALSSTNMKTYTEAVKEFTQNATAFIEQLSLLSKARMAYEKAMRASSEIRKVLDNRDEELRTLMARLEQQTKLQDSGATQKRPPETANVERIKEADEARARAFRWP